MNFNSVQFLVFFPIVVVLYSLTFRKGGLRLGLLLVASYVFYMSWNWMYAGLILFSTSVDYFVGLRMDREERAGARRTLLVVSLIINLGLLAFFKYHNFFVDSTGEVLKLVGIQLDTGSIRHSLLLPVGISFYTFQSLSYTIDLYRQRLPVERNFARFALYVAFFPQLVAGPIVRAAEFLPQLRRIPDVSSQRVNTGVALMFRGLFKKIVLADLLAGLGVDAVFASPAEFSSLTLLLAVYGYSFQIYNDFSGYSDIAIGAARVMGFDIPENFNRPYLSRNVREFWTRWHISLSSWLRDYLYIPLGGNRGAPARVRFNLLTTMVLGGLWHGAAVNFVLWGLWHGILLMLSRDASKTPEGSSVFRTVWERAACFHLVGVSWLLFRISDFPSLVDYVQGLFRFSARLEVSGVFLLVLGVAAAAHFTPKSFFDRIMERYAQIPVLPQAAVYAGLILLFSGLSFGAPAFIYFQF
ncbi:MBOAT family O-acyltransferase [Gemmatimonadota bacterium]